MLDLFYFNLCKTAKHWDGFLTHCTSWCPHCLVSERCGFWYHSWKGRLPIFIVCMSWVDDSLVLTGMKCYTRGLLLLACVFNVLIFCLIWLMWLDYVYHQSTWHPYWTFMQSRYLAALDPLTRLGSPSYLGLHLHGHATPFVIAPLRWRVLSVSVPSNGAWGRAMWLYDEGRVKGMRWCKDKRSG